MNKIIYLDAAASSLKPDTVIDAEMDFLRNCYANAGRGVCARAAAVDSMVESAREKVAEFINAKTNQIVFTNGTTDGMNRIVRILDSEYGCSMGKKTIMASDLDHHSARMPWEGAARRGRINFELCPLDADFNLDVSDAGKKPDVLVIAAMSNVLGIPQDVKEIIAKAKKINPDVITIVDAAQYVAHKQVDAVGWDCDFLCFSGHKIGADTGLGVMYIKEPEKWHTDKFGGGMVSKIGDGPWVLAAEPAKFEAGTLPLTQIAGLSAAIANMTNTMGRSDLPIEYLHSELSKIDRVKIITKHDAAMLTFVVDGMHVLDFGTLIGAHGVCLRVGNMCASWLHRRLGLPGTIRMSSGFWNTMDEMKDVVCIIKKILK